MRRSSAFTSVRRPSALRKILSPERLGACAAESGAIFSLATLPQERRSTGEEGSEYPVNSRKSSRIRSAAQAASEETARGQAAITSDSEWGVALFWCAVLGGGLYVFYNPGRLEMVLSLAGIALMIFGWLSIRNWTDEGRRRFWREAYGPTEEDKRGRRRRRRGY